MMHCRMCSQRLTRPGKLCRDCERELDRARFAAASVEGPGDLLPTFDASGAMATRSGWVALARPRASIVAFAFVLGLTGAAAIYLAGQTAPAQQSIMLERDLGAIKPRAFAPVARGASAGTHPAIDARTTGTMVQVRGEPGRDGAQPAVADAPANPRFDRVLAFSDALARCAGETYFDRLACEERARARYCDGAAERLPQCADEGARDRGQ